MNTSGSPLSSRAVVERVAPTGRAFQLLTEVMHVYHRNRMEVLKIKPPKFSIEIVGYIGGVPYEVYSLGIKPGDLVFIDSQKDGAAFTVIAPVEQADRKSTR